MEQGEENRAVRAWFVAGLAGLLLTVFAGVSPAEVPRKVAIAPFAVLTSQEDLQNIAPLLPRLLSSRLMALSGAEVLLLPAGTVSPREAAGTSGYPLLLTGSVAKLGAGYSIDVTAEELAGGKTAGSFFAAAETVDAIIPRLGDLAADISEKLFGVKTAVRSYPPPAAQPQAVIPSVQAPAAAVPALPQAAAPVSPPVPAPPSTPEQGWDPSSLTRVGESGKIADELYGVVAGDVDEDGNGEVIAWGRNVLYIYRVKGTEIVPFTRITKEITHHILNVDASDIDGDGGRELLVTDLVGDEVQSLVLKKGEGVYREVAEKIPYFLVVIPPDWQGKRVVLGQHPGFDSPFEGKLYNMRWDGKSLVPGDPLSADTSILPLSQGIFGLSSVKIGDQWKLVYTDEPSHLRVLDETGRSEFKSRGEYGHPYDLFEWGIFQPLEGRRKQYYLHKPVRTAPGEDGGDWVLVPTAKSHLFSRAMQSYEESRIVLLRWEGGEFVEKASSGKSDRFYSGADYLSRSGIRKGMKVIATVIEQPGSAFHGQVSRILLFELQ